MCSSPRRRAAIDSAEPPVARDDAILSLTIVKCAWSTRNAAVDLQFANVQPPHGKGVDGQGAHMPASYGECANDEASDGERTDRGGPERECAEGDRTKTERMSGARRCLVSSGTASQPFNLSNSFLANLHVVHGQLRAPAADGY